MNEQDLSQNLNPPQPLPPMTQKMSKLASIVRGIEWHDFQYQQFASEPKLEYSPLTLLVVSSFLVLLQIYIPNFMHMPALQYIYLTFLFSFIINYIFILRTYELYPYIPNNTYDKRLKISCLVLLISVLLCLFVGWNGSGGILFAIGWEVSRGSRINDYKIFYFLVIIGSLLLQNNYSIGKLIQFIPGIMFGIISSQLFLFKKSNCYSITHQFTFLITILMPLVFPASDIRVLTGFQWLAIVVGGFIMYFTILISVRLMQNVRASVVMTVSSAVVMAGTSSYESSRDMIGLGLMAVGGLLLIKKQFYDIEV